MRILALLFFGLLLTFDLYGQGFNTYNGRNHPELKWLVAETEHFEIMYPRHLSGIETKAAPIAEAAYEVLSANLDVTFDRKIRIYLSDEDEITNGFAVGVGTGYTNIWVHVNDAAEVWTGEEKWLRKVIAHELTHLFHFRAVRSNLGFLSFLFGDPMPRFWAEGLAQYETEVWDAQRGERWLRTAVLDDRLSYNDGRSVWNGRLLYASGNSQLRYFADQYGDTTLSKLLKHRKRVLFGLGEVHDFGRAFEEITDKSYRRFFDDWRRHVNVYYNTLAGQMERPDSLRAAPLQLPGQYRYDIKYSPDTTHVAVLSLVSLQRPFRRLYVVDRDRKSTRIVAEGSIKAPVSWSPDGKRLAFARTVRSEHGSLLNDLFVVDADGRNLRRLTYGRRASSPVFSPDSSSLQLLFIGSDAGTANLFLLDLETGNESPLTAYTGDVQISSVAWSPDGSRLAYALFDEDGTRSLVVYDLKTHEQRVLSTGKKGDDDRLPVWSPDGQSIAFTSFRDRVPNVFVHSLETGATRRVTYLATGATAYDWLPPDSLRTSGSLVIVSDETKENDRAYRIDARRKVSYPPPVIPKAYQSWITHRPPNEVPAEIPEDSSLITARYDYRSWKNVTHAVSVAVPYYDNPKDWGVIGLTTWFEPLGKHIFSTIGGLSFASPLERSLIAGTYINNQWHPTVGISLYHMPGSSRFYGNELLVENYLGGDVTLEWPLDVGISPFTATRLGFRARYVDIDPLSAEDVEELDGLPPPEAGQQADLRLSLTHRKQRPYRFNTVHPLDGFGARLQLEAALPVLGGNSRFVRGDLAAYGIIRSIGLHRLFLYARARIQEGDSFAQDYVGLSRHDDIQLDIPEYIPFTLGESERVRGFRRYALGSRMLFGTAEYRMLLLPDLQTRLLGIVSLGSTALALFSDAGMVWSGSNFDDAIRRVGVGVELKNELRLGGVIGFAHALGVAQPASAFGSGDEYEVYYRIRASVPF